jgi:hypothetical protein
MNLSNISIFSIIKRKTAKMQLLQDHAKRAFLPQRLPLCDRQDAERRVLECGAQEQHSGAACQNKPLTLSTYAFLPVTLRNPSLEACTRLKGLQVAPRHYFFIFYILLLSNTDSLENQRKQ